MIRASKGVLLAGAILGALLATTPLISSEEPTLGHSDSPFCSISVSPFGLTLGGTYFLGSFSERVVEATPGPINPTGLPGHVASPTNGETIWGQHMRVTAAGGWSADAIHDGSRSLGQEVVLVLWDYDPSCSVTQYTGTVPFGIPGEEALVLGRLRDPDQWVDGIPTLDTFWGGGLVYPMAVLSEERDFLEWVQSEYPSPRWEEQESLSPAEAFELMTKMPEPCEELWSPVSFAAKAAVLTITYVSDERYPVPNALRVLEDRARFVERIRPFCLGDPRKVTLPR